MQYFHWGDEDSSSLRRGRWHGYEIDRLETLWGTRDEGDVARLLGRPLDSVLKMAAEVFSGRIRTGRWTDEDIAFLRKNLGAGSLRSIAQVLRRSLADVERNLAALREEEKSTGVWPAEDVQSLKRLYGTRTDEDLAVILCRTQNSIQLMAARLRLAKDKAFLRRVSGEGGASRMPRWSLEELELLAELYPTASNLEIAKLLGRSVKSIVSKAYTEGLKKDPERLREMGRQNVRRRYRGRRRKEGG